MWMVRRDFFFRMGRVLWLMTVWKVFERIDQWRDLIRYRRLPGGKSFGHNEAPELECPWFGATSDSKLYQK